MIMNNSPWISELQDIRYPNLSQDIQTDILIIWWWISWCITAHFLLQETQQNIVIVEWNKIASWATWHNAWRISTETEVDFQYLIENYGIDKASNTRKWLVEWYENLWSIIDLYNIDIQSSKLMWYEAISQFDHFIRRLNQKILLSSVGIESETILLSENSTRIDQIPKKSIEHISIVPQSTIANFIQSSDGQYQWLRCRKWWTINSALLSQKLLQELKSHYKNRINIYENTQIKNINPQDEENYQIISQTADWHNIKSQKAVLCTNWFENLNINNQKSNKYFHKNTKWVIWYMTWYILDWKVDDSAVSYYPSQNNILTSDCNSDVYYYMTERWYNINDSTKRLICLWWPEKEFPENKEYTQEWSEECNIDNLKQFAYDTIKNINPQSDNKFSRHWLMSYTESKLRYVWPDPTNPNILYNLWCNWVWIVSSLYWWKLIKQYINQEEIQPNVFKPE
jgi:hypothetical protein